MTKSTITRERLEWLSQISCRDDIEDIGGDEIRELARMALAAMDSEPVADVVAWSHPTEERTCDVRLRRHDLQPGPLYRHAHPAPVVPVSQKDPISFDDWSRKCALQVTLCYSDFREKAQYIWDSARETMHVEPSVPVLTRAYFESWCKKRFALSPSYFEKDASGVYTGTLVHDMYIAWEACRATMLQASPVCTCPSGDGSLRWPCPVHAGSSPVIPDGYVLVPMRLTAENGAKGALSGEFSETKFVNCPECFGDDECETCDGSGRIEITVPVTWTTIKEIWAKGVEHFSATPREVKGE